MYTGYNCYKLIESIFIYFYIYIFLVSLYFRAQTEIQVFVGHLRYCINLFFFFPIM